MKRNSSFDDMFAMSPQSRTATSPSRRLLFLMIAAAVSSMGIAIGCSDTNLYSPTHELRQNDRVGVTGRVCSEDPVAARFPLRIILVVDESNGPLYSSYDSASQRIQVLRDFVQTATATRENEIAVIGYGGVARKIAPETDSFTRNPGDLNNALTQLQNPVGCFAEGQCRNLRGAVQLARTLIEDDIAQTPRGLRTITQYTVIHLHSGAPSPLADGADCCADGDIQCQDEQQGPSYECEAQLAGDAVSELRQAIANRGASGLRYHTIHWAAEAPDEDGDDLDDSIQPILESMAFNGRGSFQRFNVVDNFTLASVNLLGARVAYHARMVIASNMNVLPGPDGPVVDSDSDGLPDHIEEELGTSPTNPDTSGDGITDLVKLLAGFDPQAYEPFVGCENLPEQDLDSTSDGLTDCDNRVLGTDPSLIDSSGDGMPDVMEVRFGTNFLRRDAHLDYDGDGVSNGDEIRQHTDPRSVDNDQHLTYGYRYHIEDEGFVRDLRAERLRDLTGVDIVNISGGSTAGVGTVFYDPSDQTLAWRDASDSNPGPPVKIDEDQPLLLASSSWSPEQGEDGRFIEVELEAQDLPEERVNETVRVVFRDRQCLRYTIRNIKLMETLELDDGTAAGTNRILLFFSQAPDGRLDVPGPFRIASIPIRYTAEERSPSAALIEVADEQFVRPRLFNAPWELSE